MFLLAWMSSDIKSRNVPTHDLTMIQRFPATYTCCHYAFETFWLDILRVVPYVPFLFLKAFPVCGFVNQCFSCDECGRRSVWHDAGREHTKASDFHVFPDTLKTFGCHKSSFTSFLTYHTFTQRFTVAADGFTVSAGRQTCCFGKQKVVLSMFVRISCE